MILPNLHRVETRSEHSLTVFIGGGILSTAALGRARRKLLKTLRICAKEEP